MREYIVLLHDISQQRFKTYFERPGSRQIILLQFGYCVEVIRTRLSSDRI